MPLMVFPNCRRMKDQELLACSIPHQNKGHKAGNAYSDVSDA